MPSNLLKSLIILMTYLKLEVILVFLPGMYANVFLKIEMVTSSNLFGALYWQLWKKEKCFEIIVCKTQIVILRIQSITVLLDF